MKNTWIVTLLFAALICTAVFVSRANSQSGRQHAEQDENTESRIGLAISPVKLNLQNRDVHMVGLGSYIVNAQSACADCHSCPTYAVGHNPYRPTQAVQSDEPLAAECPLAHSYLPISRRTRMASQQG